MVIICDDFTIPQVILFQFLILGSSGQYCSKITNLFSVPIHEQCEPCADSKQRIDNEFGGVYSFACKTASKMTNCVGFRRRGEAKLTDPEKLMDPAAIRHRYGYAVDEVPEELFLAENKTSKYYFCFYSK